MRYSCKCSQVLRLHLPLVWSPDPGQLWHTYDKKLLGLSVSVGIQINRQKDGHAFSTNSNAVALNMRTRITITLLNLSKYQRKIFMLSEPHAAILELNNHPFLVKLWICSTSWITTYINYYTYMIVFQNRNKITPLVVLQILAMNYNS